MKVQDLMTTDVRSCRPTDTLDAAARIMWEVDCGCVPIVDEQSHVVGMITDRDISMAAYTQGRRLAEIPIAAAMASHVFVVKPKEELAAAEELMRARAVRRLPVVEDDGHLTGILSLSDIARAAIRQKDQKERKSRELTTEELSDTLAAVSEPRTPAAPARS